MTSLPTKRPRSDSQQGELRPHAVEAKIDDETVFDKLLMDVPEGALVDNTETADDTALDMNVKDELSKLPEHSRLLLRMAIDTYQYTPMACSYAVSVLASILLPVIFKDKQHSLEERYKDTINSNPWLVKMLVNAYNAETYSDIRRIGLCRSWIVSLPRLILPAHLRCPPFTAQGGVAGAICRC